MGKFQAGQPRPANAGRKKGSPNIYTRTVRGALETAFATLQRDPQRNLVAWAKASPENLRSFYQLSAKLLPLVEVNLGTTPVDITTPEARLDTARRVAFLLASGVQAQDEIALKQQAVRALTVPPPLDSSNHDDSPRPPPTPVDDPTMLSSPSEDGRSAAFRHAYAIRDGRRPR